MLERLDIEKGRCKCEIQNLKNFFVTQALAKNGGDASDSVKVLKWNSTHCLGDVIVGAWKKVAANTNTVRSVRFPFALSHFVRVVLPRYDDM